MTSPRPLGSSSLQVFPLALGGNVFGWTADEDRTFAVLDEYVAAGGNFVDTADSYSAWAPGNEGGESETLIGKWLASRSRRDDVVIATKVGAHPAYKGLSSTTVKEAAEASLRLLGDDVSAPRRRVVLAADVDVAITLPDGDTGPRSQVLLPGPVAWADVVSIHVDEEDAATDVAAAVGAVEAADAGDDDAQFVVDGAEGHDLLWFDVTETSLVLTDLEVG